MGISLVIGCGLVAFGPSLMLWVVVVGKKPALVIIGLVGAFFWLASIAAASVLWTILPAAQDAWVLTMITSVGLQTFGRLALARVYVKTETVVNDAADAAAAAFDADELRSGGAGGAAGGGSRYGGVLEGDGRGGAREGPAGEGDWSGGSEERRQDLSGSLKLDGISSSIAAGVGWGLMHAVILVGTALSKHMGPGAAFSPSCPRVPSVFVSAVSAQAFVILDLLLMAAAFAAARTGDAGLMFYSFGLHFSATLTTGFNFLEGGCAVSLPLLYGEVVLSAVILARHGPFRSAMTRLRR